MPRTSRTGQRRRWAIACIISGLLLNQWTIGHFLSHDGSVDDPALKVAIGFLELLLIAAGVSLLLRRKPVSRRRLLFQGIVLLICVGMLEGGLRVADYVIERRHPKPQPEYLRSPYREKPWAKELYDELDDLAYINRSFRYHPFLGWDAKPYEGEYVNVDASGIRKTWNPDFPPDVEPQTIYVFGGSTTWGMGARDQDTLPSHLSRLLNEHGRPFVVRNYGDIAYTFTQELINLILLLKAGHRPDYVIFYDGVNDVYAAYQSGRPGSVIDCFHLPEKFNERMTPLRAFWIGVTGLLREHCMIYRYAGRLAGSSGRPADFPEVGATFSDEQLRDLAERVADDYATSHALLEPLSKAYGFDYLTFWQPVSLTEEHLLPEERLDIRTEDKALAAVHRYILGDLRERELKNFWDVSDALRGRDTLYYLDYCHLTGQGNAAVARRMCEILETYIETPPQRP